MQRFFPIAAFFLFACLPPLQADWQNDQKADLVLGQPNLNTGIAGLSASELDSPVDVAVDPTTGNVFVADTGNSRVLRFASLAALTDGAAALGVLGQPDLDSNNFVLNPTVATLKVPRGIAVDANGTLWVADTLSNRVLRFDNASTKAGPNGADADGVLGQALFTTQTAGTTNKTMSNPVDVAIDANGTLWVVDGANNRVLRFASAAFKADGAAAEGVLGQTVFTTSASSPLTASSLSSPRAAAVDGSVLWVSDGLNNRILRFDAADTKNNGSDADGVLGQALFTTNASGTDEDSINTPGHLSASPNGDLWVSDVINNRVLRFANAAAKDDGDAADTVLGQPGFNTSAAGISDQRLNVPDGVATVGNTAILITDQNNHRVLRFRDPASPVVAIAPQNSALKPALQAKIKKLKKAIKRAKKKRQTAKVKRLKKKLKRLLKQLRALP